MVCSEWAVGRRKKFGEESGFVNVRVPKSKVMSGYDFLSKFIIFGDRGVGKTTLEAHLDPVFGAKNLSEFTIGVSFRTKNVEVKGSIFKMQIWLMSNEDRFVKMPEFSMQLTGSSGAIILYDITNPSSLDKVPIWCKILEDRCGKIPILLVGNKVDEEEGRIVSKTRALEVREKHDLASYMEISAKTGENVEKMFDLVGELLLKKYHP